MKGDSSNAFSRWLGFFRPANSESKSQQTSHLSTKTTLERRDASDVSQFEGYLSGIPLDIRKIRNKKQSKSVTNNSLKMQLLEKCYRNIPPMYFQEAQTLDFDLFCKSRRKTEESQEKVGEYLDQVEVCLFNQVTSRFDQFVAVLRTIEALDMLVRDNLARISIVKVISTHMRKQLLNKSMVILNLQKKKEARQQVLNRLLALQKARNAKEYIKGEITDSREECLALIEQLRSNKASVEDLHCAKEYERWVEDCEAVLKRDFTENFSEWLFKYITLNASYDRHFWEQLALRKDLFTRVEDLGNSTMLFDDELEFDHRRLPGVEIVPEMEDKIVNILLNGWGNGELGVGPAKSALDEHFIQEFENILSDIREFSYDRLVEAGEGSFDKYNLESLLEHMSIEFYSRVMEYYSLILKRYFRRLFSVSKKCLKELIEVSVGAKEWEVERLHSVMESLFNIQLFVVKSNLEKFIQLVNIKKIGANVDYFRFKSYLGVLESWQGFFNNEVVALYSQIQVPAESTIKERFYVLKNKLNARYVTDSKNELILTFFTNLHKFTLNVELKKSLEDDTWQVVDIPTSFYEPLGVLLSAESWAWNRRRSHNNTLESSLFVDRDTSHRNRSLVKQGDSEDKNNINFKLIKNECIISGKTYKFTESFLLLVEILEEYLRIHDSFQSVSEEVASGIVKLCGFFNSYSFKLIVEAGAVSFNKLKTKNITARHLAISSLCLEFLLLILQNLGKRVKMHNYKELTDNISTHHTEIIKKLRAILQVKISKALPEVILGRVPSSGTLSIINSTKALFDILSEFYSSSDILRRIFDVDIFSKYLGQVSEVSVGTLERAEILKEELGFFFGQLGFLSKVVAQFSLKRSEGDALIMRVFESL